MKHLDNFKIFEANSTWWEEKLSDYFFDYDEIRDYFNYITDEFGVSPYIETGFWDKNFKGISKKLDVLERKYYPGYTVRIQVPTMRKIKEVILWNKYLENALEILDKNYSCWINIWGGGYVYLICLDKTQEFDPKSVEFKGKNKDKKVKNLDYYLEVLNKHQKLLKAEKSPEDDYILISPNEPQDFEKVQTILNRMFSKDDISFTEKVSKITNSPISRTGWTFVFPNDANYNRTRKQIRSIMLTL